jgi:cellulose synthase/poly-beta-1,6-N-acetylglucosamine synthase-like glycosyltransferase
MVPCKGHDIDLERNLRSAINQDYRNFRPIAIVESERDAAFPAIKRSGIEYIIADYKCTKCSGKVRNLCSAISRFPEYELLCIMDSDVNAPRWWLSRLVAAMDQHTGIATSYPIFNPIGGFGSYMKHVWGFNGFSLMENSRTRFGWGGSLLFRRKLLRGDGMKRFENSISDDIALTALCKANRMKIAYVPDAAPIVDCSDTFSEFIEWSNRQTALAVYGNRKLRAYGLVAYGAQTLLLVSGIFMALFYSPVFLLFLVPFVIGLTKALRRSHKSWLSVGASYALINFIYLYNLANTFFMHSIVWRGRRYSLS